MKKNEVREYFFRIQENIQKDLSIGKSIDDILDESEELRNLELWLPEEEYGILILTILNNFKSDLIIDTLVDSVIKMKSES